MSNRETPEEEAARYERDADERIIEEGSEKEVARASGEEPEQKDNFNAQKFLYDVEVDILSYKPQTKDEMKEDIIGIDLLPLAKNQVNIISAGGGAKKSMVALKLMMRLSNQGIGTLGIFSEESTQQVRNRIDYLSKGEPDFMGDNMAFKTLDRSLPSCEDHLIKILRYASSQKDNMIDLLIIDPFISVFTGDENSNADAKQFINKISRACYKAKITVLFLHHSAKDNLNARGAGAITDACRVSYHLMPILDGNDKPLDSEVSLVIHKENVGVKYLTGKTNFTIHLGKPKILKLNSKKKDGTW